MARAARSRGDVDLAPGVKLYVASSGWPYKPHHSPDAPLLIFHRGDEEPGVLPPYVKAGGHSCRRYVDVILSVVQPEHDNVFVIDLSQVASVADWRAEAAKPGRCSRMLEKWFTKFNPSAATVMTFGEEAGLLMPLLRIGGERRIQRVIHCGTQPLSEKVAQQLQTEAEVVHIPEQSLEAVATAVDHGGWPDTLCIDDLFFVSVDFSLNPNTKQMVQTAQNITQAVAHPAGPAVLPAALQQAAAPKAAPAVTNPLLANGAQSSSVDKAGYAAQASKVTAPPTKAGAAVQGVAIHHLTPGMSFANLVAEVAGCTPDGQVLRAVLADTHATVEAIVPRSFQSKMGKGHSVALDGRVLTADSHLYITVDNAVSHGGLREGYTAARIGQRNVSQHRRRYGCLLLRGNRCVLGRLRNNKMVIPSVEAKIYETSEQAATRAIAEACDIYQEEFALLRDVAPAVVYDMSDADAPPCVVTIFAALAVNPPPADVDEEESEDEEDLYDWYSYEKALSRLQTSFEREAVSTLARSARRAIDVGVVLPEFPCPFGQQAVAGAGFQFDASAAPGSQAAGTALLPGSALTAAAVTGPMFVTVLNGSEGVNTAHVFKPLLENKEGVKVAVLVHDHKKSPTTGWCSRKCTSARVDQRSPEHLAVERYRKSPEMTELSNGCVCVSISEQGVRRVMELFRQGHFEHVLVDSTGASELAAVGEAVVFQTKSDAEVVDLIPEDLASVGGYITVVDAATLLATLDGLCVYSKARAQLLAEQVEAADSIVVTNSEVLAEDQRTVVQEFLRKLNPEAFYYDAVRGSQLPVTKVLNAKRASAEAQVAVDDPSCAVKSFVYRRRKPFHPQRLNKLFQDPQVLPTGAFRARGVSWIASRPGFQGLLSFAGRSRRIEKGPAWWATTERHTWPEGLWVDLEALWEEPHGDRMQEIVCIGTFKQEELEQALDACLATEEEVAAQSFADELPSWPAEKEEPAVVNENSAFFAQALEPVETGTPYQFEAGWGREI
eukprot:TRINITY_DN27598_c0_g3_i1.p1 TRINITY_DN27598_c0_g3~~TRINITY_DN27598_c0_g3_i1.p1  ORF type:complete len:1005 (+),score=243.55 TRINITY_DN27598_c0_g3_i1:182-3196(+)